MKWLLLAVFFFLGCGTSTEVSKGIIVPQYFYDSALWDKVINADIGGYVIINPSNGPGDSADSAYVNEINELNAHSKIPIGYIYTKWGDRSIDDVKADIDKWLELYSGIKGFFVDEAASSADKSEYYTELADYIKSKGDYKIVLNPGTKPDAVYFGIADTVVVYESNASAVPDDVCSNYSDKSAIIVYGADEEEMENLVNRPCKYIYVTDDNDSNPYDSLPSYFDEEIDALK